jgi:hypothetical protein
MARAESNIFTRCRKALSAAGARLFRNNVGAAYIGKGMTMTPGQVYRAQGGERLIFAPQHVEFGLFKGSADGIGWVSRTITPDMVGTKVAVFLSVETKAGRGTATDDQNTWAENVRRGGGIAIITNNEEDALWQMTQTEHKI